MVAMILQFLIMFAMSFGLSERTPNSATLPTDWEVSCGLKIGDNKIKYLLEREDGEQFYGLFAIADLTKGGRNFGGVLQGEVFDKEAQEIYRENISTGIYGNIGQWQARGGIGISYNHYKDPLPCFISEVRYKRSKIQNPLLELVQKLIMSWDYEARLNFLYAKNRTEYGLETLATFNFTKVIGFELLGLYRKTDREFQQTKVSVVVNL